MGLEGYAPESEGSVWFRGQDQTGNDVRVDVFNTVFTGGQLNSKTFEVLLNYLEHTNNLDFSGFIKDIEYQGFDRLFYIRAALKRVTPSQFCRFAIMGAVRGSNFQRIIETSISVPDDLKSLVTANIVIKKAVKRDDLTILRFTASVPHWVSYWLFKVDFQKKIEDSDCPGWLQYPGAASLPMSKKLRLQHIQFCKSFSSLLPGGKFNPNIYLTAYKNSIPERDIPTMLKDQLGVGQDRVTQMTESELRESIGTDLVKVSGR
jgi:hypothetical protein